MVHAWRESIELYGCTRAREVGRAREKRLSGTFITY